MADIYNLLLEELRLNISELDVLFSAIPSKIEGSEARNRINELLERNSEITNQIKGD